MSGVEDGIEDVAEHPLGWARVWLFALAGLAVPFWMLSTAVYIQLSPALNGAEFGMSPSEVPWGLWFWAAVDVFCAMLWVLPVAAVVLVGARLGQLALQRRNRAQREQLAASIGEDAVIDDEAWK